MVSRWIWFFLDNPLITFLCLLAVIFTGIYVLPFPMPAIERHIDRAPVPVDAIPDIGENQQIVFTEWPGRSPQDVEDQISYPLAVALQGIPGVKSIRSYSMFGFSSIYIIFEENIEFYWSRSRVLERLAVAQKDLPAGVTPVLGPDATALGQIFWYTLEGKGFSLEELRTIQDWYVRYALQSAYGVSEVASIGGFVREYQIDVDPAPLWEYKIKLSDIFKAVKRANIDVGARTIEHNGAEYVIRGIGFIKSIKDVENIVVKEVNNVPIYVKNIAHVSLGPALRRGALDKEGAEAVGGVVVVRYGENPLKVIEAVKKKIAQIQPGLPQKKLPDGTISQVKIVPFYDRTDLIYETLDTLSDALINEILLTIIVVILFLIHFRSSMVVSLALPIGVLMAFIFMKIFKVDSNIMSLSGIAIVIGTMVDMGIIMTENVMRHLKE
ncbi:MAG: efflux RND transporter permease subunit, partial [Planctomycetota bacterium]